MKNKVFPKNTGITFRTVMGKEVKNIFKGCPENIQPLLI